MIYGKCNKLAWDKSINCNTCIFFGIFSLDGRMLFYSCRFIGSEDGNREILNSWSEKNK